MKSMRKTIFISDLHLEESQPRITQEFFTLLNNCDDSVDALYILGDLFEAWIGDYQCAFHQTIFQKLKSAAERIPIYFLAGNRDFLINQKFHHATQCQLLPDEKKIILYGTPVLLLHGDTLCTLDIAYIHTRKKMRNTFLQYLFLLLPLSIRKKIAARLRTKSMMTVSTLSEEMMDVVHKDVVNVMEKYQVYSLIHGHTHKPAIHKFTLDNHPATRIVLPAWHDKGGALIWYENGKYEFVNTCLTISLQSHN